MQTLPRSTNRSKLIMMFSKLQIKLQFQANFNPVFPKLIKSIKRNMRE